MNELKNEYEWKWSKGEVYYKSARQNNNARIKRKGQGQEQEQEQEPEQEEQYMNEININEINDSAIKQSIEGFHFTRNDTLNKREDLDNKISDRELIYQRGTNPYLGNDNYLKDITARDIFLKPKNTTIDN
jgi:hypothetical protein